jgi:hypothetical protein
MEKDGHRIIVMMRINEDDASIFRRAILVSPQLRTARYYESTMAK